MVFNDSDFLFIHGEDSFHWTAKKNCFHIQHTFGKIYESKAITDILLDRK